MKKLALVFILLLIISSIPAQTIVRGKITDGTGETLIGVTIVLKSNRGIGTVTDFDGNYSLKIADSSSQTLVISFIGFNTIEENIMPTKGVIDRNFVMMPESHEINEVEITSKAIKANDYYMEKMKMNSSASIDYISSETIKKTGDANVGAAVARIPGVSTNSGGFITVRGIGDRYVKTTINGSRIPTLDPFTNNIKLDLIPSSLIDNIIITKTSSPDLPGDWTGAYLSVETKDYPDKLNVSVESSFGYNYNSSFRKILSSEHSSTDWMAYDNDFRSIDHSTYSVPRLEPTQYQEMTALGLGDYFNTMGVTPSAWNTTFFNLGLVQLNLLENSQLGDENAVAAATVKYNETLKLEAFDILNKKTVDFGQSLPNNWTTKSRSTLLNFSQSFSIGNQTKLFGKPLGFIAGFRYSNGNQFDAHSSANRIIVDPTSDTVSVFSVTKQKNTVEMYGWSALLNVAYKFNSNHTMSFLFMPNFIGTNNVRSGSSSGFLDSEDTLYFINQFYEQRRQMVYQYKSEHYFPKPKIKVEANASYTRGKSSAPDFKNLAYLKTQAGDYTIGGGNPVQRFYRELTENLFDSRLTAEIPLGKKAGLTRKFKFGGAYQHMSRKSDQYQYSVNLTGNSRNFDGNIEQYLSLENFGVQSGTFNGTYYHTLDLNYLEAGRSWDHNVGRNNITSAFMMVDYALIRLRVSGGVRMEKAFTRTDALKYDTLNYSSEDPRRNFVYPAELEKTNYLPSIGLIYKLRKDEAQPINLRVNYGRTVARPSIRELSSFFAYDYELRASVIGNPKLKVVDVNNYDLRFETYFKSGDNISFSLFYKDFKNHIELINAGGYTWQNVDNSFVRGLELEGKKVIKKIFEIRANISLVNSRSSFDQYGIQIDDVGNLERGPFQFHVSRTMFGQAPYVINTMFSYKADSIGLTTTLSYNVQGPKLVIPGFLITPDVYEHPRHIIDLKATKKLGKHFNLSLTIRDVLAAPVRRTYRRDGKWLSDYDRFKYGTSYILSLQYKI